MLKYLSDMYIATNHSYCCCICMDICAEATPAKQGRPKRSRVSLQDRYPTLSPELEGDPSAHESNQEALAKEMKSAKPRSEVYIPLMKATFMARRQFILTEAKSVVQILGTYPALKHICAVSFVLSVSWYT